MQNIITVFTYVGIHGLNGADAFEEMDSWSREIKTHEGGNENA